MIFLVGYTACKVCPPFHILYLIKEEDGLTVIHAMIGLQYKVEVCFRHSLQAFIVKVDIYYIFYLNSICQQLLNSLV